jgi:hypothetical protein
VTTYAASVFGWLGIVEAPDKAAAVRQLKALAPSASLLKSDITPAVVHRATPDEIDWHVSMTGPWQKGPEGGKTLHAVPGCGHCADIVAAGLLTSDSQFYDRLKEHLENHEFKSSIWGEVTELAKQVRP